MQINSNNNIKITNRILQLIEVKGITKYKFHKDLGFSNGFLDKSRDIGTDKYAKIIAYFPDVNTNWLLTGEGEMFKKETIPDSEIDYKEEAVKGLVARVKLLEKSVDTLNTALVVQSGIFQKEVSVNRLKKIDPEIFNSVKHFYKNDLSKFDIEDLKKTYVFLSDEVVLEQASLYETAYKTE